MRNVFLILLVFQFIGCSVENDTLDDHFNVEKTANLEIYEPCEPVSFDIKNNNVVLGHLSISNNNDGSVANVNFEAIDGFAISKISLLKVSDVSELPQNNGGIIPGKLESYAYSAAKSAEFEFALNDKFILTSYVTFTDSSNNTYVVWVGDKFIGKKGSAYLEYEACINLCDADAGDPKSLTFTNAYVLNNLYTPARLERYFLNYMLEPGVPKDGEFNPTPEQLIQSYVKDNFQTFTTTYTVYGDNCSDSVQLSITVTP